MTSCDLQQYVAIVRISCRSRRLAASVMASSPRRGWRQRRRLADRTTRSYIDINPRLTARPPGPPTTIALASPLQSHSPRLALSLSLSLPDTSLICRCVGGHVVHRGSRRYGPIEHCQRAATAASCRVPRACFSSLNCCLLPTTELGRTWSTRLTGIDINCRLLSQTGAAQLRTARDTADAASMSVRLLQRNGNYVRRSCSKEMISLTEY